MNEILVTKVTDNEKLELEKTTNKTDDRFNGHDQRPIDRRRCIRAYNTSDCGSLPLGCVSDMALFHVMTSHVDLL